MSSGDTTTTTNTSSSSGEQQQHQQDQQQPAGTATSSSSTASIEVDSQQLRHWASPEELLGIKNLLGDLRLRHNTEIQQLTAALDQTRAENEILRRDAQAFGRLKDAYIASENDFQRMKTERSSWHEEREMLVLKLQQASNEIMRLKQEKSAAGTTGGGSSTTSGSQGRAPSSGSSGTTTGSSSLFGSSSSSGGSSSNSSQGSAFSLENNKYVLALAESEHRRQCEVRELTSRFEFQQLTNDMSCQKLLQRVAATEAEFRITQEKLTQYKDKMHSLQLQCDSSELRFADLEATASKRISQVESEMRKANEARESAQEQLRHLNKEHSQQLETAEEQYKSKVAELVQENTTQCTMLSSSLNRAVAASQKYDDTFTKEREQLMEELRSLNDLLSKERAKADNDCQQLSQKLQLLTDERDELLNRYEENQSECTRLRTRLDVCSDTIAELRNEVDELNSAAARQTNAESQMALKLHTIQQLQVERDSVFARCESLEQQIHTLGSALERERTQSVIAMELLQRKRQDKENEIEKSYSKQIDKLQRKYSDTKLRLRELVAWREANEPPKIDRAASSAVAAPRLDAVAVMTQQFQSASLLAKQSNS